MKGSVENLPYVKMIKWRDGCDIKYLVFPHKTRYGYPLRSKNCIPILEPSSSMLIWCGSGKSA
jgi:hypothetical protein